MNSGADDRAAGDRMVTVDLFRILVDQRATIARIVAIVTGVVLVLTAAYYLWLQPRRTVVALQFRPAFEGAKEGEYPNKMKFAASDVLSGTVVAKVFAANELQQYCPYAAFASGLFTEASSSELRLLERDYAARLSDPRLTQVDRERIQSEYRERVASIDPQYRLSFMRSPACGRLPVDVAVKSLGQILEGWAEEADHRRGVLKLRVPMLTPNVLDVQFPADGCRLIRAELIRTALVKVIANVREVERISGAELIRVDGPQRSFVEVRTRLEELVRARLEPIVSASTDARSQDALLWVQESLDATLVSQRVAEQRANAYRVALREYSNVPGTSAAAQGGESGAPGASADDLRALVRPQIDRTFVDRLVELAEPNAEFREEMSRQMIEETLVAVDYDAEASHFRRLLGVLRGRASASLPILEIDRRLQAIVEEGKALVAQFNRLYEEFSAIALSSGSEMYRLEGIPQVSTSEPLTFRDLVVVVMAALILSGIGATIFVIARSRFQAVA